jgi:hypothetical protein
MIKSHHTDEKILRLLLSRLERISADSYWAHRASGVRGSLLKVVDAAVPSQNDNFEMLVKMGFDILEAAAREKTK